MKIHHDLPHKTKIKDWEHLGNCSVRLYNILIEGCSLESNGRFNNWKYIEDINKEMFYNIRNAGHKSWAEFHELRGY